MGCWAEGSFGNDGAGDWAIEVRENPTFNFIRKTLQTSIDTPHNSWANEQSIAAAEMLCILNGIIPTDYEEVSHNLEPAVEILKKQQIPSGLKELALKSVETIEQDSELKEVWEDMDEWTTEIVNLKKRLLEI